MASFVFKTNKFRTTKQGTFIFDNAVDTGFLTDNGFATSVSALVNEIEGTESADTLLGTSSADIIRGHGGNDRLYGRGDIDELHGGDGNDSLDGGDNGDLMFGGAGSDTYVVDDELDACIEVGELGEDPGGTDTIKTLLGYTDLNQIGTDDRIENLVLLTGATDAAGNALANRIVGNSAANNLSGLGGADTIDGGAGNDTLDGGADNDQLMGGAGADLLYGEGGDDILSGGTGFDTMYGGSGNDWYLVDDWNDVASEDDGAGSDSGGIDTVKSSAIEYALGAVVGGGGVEDLKLLAGAVVGYGNALGNTIVGNSEDNFLAGREGNDRIFGNDGTDLLFGEEGNDTISGGAGDDDLRGGMGDDFLDGGEGADNMQGGFGNDTYIVNNLSDQAYDGNDVDDGGHDLVKSSVDWTLDHQLEDLVLAGTLDINGIGNALANKITGNTGANILFGDDGADSLIGSLGDDSLGGGVGNDYLSGGGGRDRLEGGSGNDRLIGGLDADIFVLDAPGLDAISASLDTIVDFSSTADDKIAVHGTDYGLLAGTLDPGKFALSGAPDTGEARFLYNASARTLLWDHDGQGNDANMAIAVFASPVPLTANDFLIL